MSHAEVLTEEDAIDSLACSLGLTVAEGVWNLCCSRLDLRRPVADPADLRRMADLLMDTGGLLRMSGRSLRVRAVAREALDPAEADLADDSTRPAIQDVDRLTEVVRLGLDAGGADPDLQHLLEDVAERLGTPFALVTVLLDAAQVTAAAVGPIPDWMVEAGGIPVEWSFCGPMARTAKPLVVPDFTADDSYRDNPLVTAEGLRSYAGVPLVTSHGHVVGGLCVVDVRPRTFTDQDVAFLQKSAPEVVRRIEERAYA